MMNKEDYNHFVCIVASDSPEELIKKYQYGTLDKPIVKYAFKDAGVLRKNYIELYTQLISRSDDELEKIFLEEELDGFIEDTDVEFFYRVTEDYEHDPKTGDALCYDNPDGHYVTCEQGKKLSVPFVLTDGTEAFQAKKSDIDWSALHMANKEPYEIAWDTVVGRKKAKTPMEKTIFSNMKDMKSYLLKFDTKENYVASSCSFWGYAFLSEETGWVELEPNVNQFEWVSCFFEKFIVPLQPETLLTIYECRK